MNQNDRNKTVNEKANPEIEDREIFNLFVSISKSLAVIAEQQVRRCDLLEKSTQLQEESMLQSAKQNAAIRNLFSGEGEEGGEPK